MRVTITRLLDHEFFTLSAEADPTLPPDEGARDLLGLFEAELNHYGLKREDVVRHRLWGRDRETWTGGRERFKFFSEAARAASSSYLSPRHFHSDAQIAFDVFAMRPLSADSVKHVEDYDPPTTVLRYLNIDNVVVLSGNTYDQGQLSDQLNVILPRITQTLAHAGTSWRQVARMSCLLQRDEQLDNLKGLLTETLGADQPIDAQEFQFVDAFSTPGKLIEVEVTAAL